MALTVYWRHLTITDSAEEGRVVVESDNPTETHAVAGGGWIGGPLSSTATNGADAEAPAVAQYPAYDSGSDTTRWVAVFKLPKGGTARCHVWSAVQS